MMPRSARIRSSGILDEDGSPVWAPYAVDITDDGLISYCGSAATAPASTGPVVTVDGLLMAGLTNWHSHAPMVVLRDVVPVGSLERWLTRVWELESLLGPDDVYWGALTAFGEMLRHGITASVEMYFHDHALLEAAEAVGLRCCVTPGVNEARPFIRRFGGWRSQLERALDLKVPASADGRVSVGLSVHSPYAVSETVFREVCGHARQRGRTFHFHCAERPADQELSGWDSAEFGQAMQRAGADYPNVIAAHCVNLTARDWSRIAAWDWRVALCPLSNMALGVGLPAVPESCRDRIVRLGTDGPLVSPLDVLRSAQPLTSPQARARPGRAWRSPDLMRAARAPAGGRLGLPPAGNGLSVGGAADLVAIDLDPAVVSAGERWHLRLGDLVSDVWVAGRRVVADRTIAAFDFDEARRKVTAIRRRLLAGS